MVCGRRRCYWFPAWQPTERGKPHLSADAITGLVATAFLRHYADLPLLEKFFTALRTKVHLTANPATATNPLESIPVSLFCRAAHVAFRPGVIKLDEKHSSTGLRAVASKTLRPCSQECCRETETILGGCISRESFDNADLPPGRRSRLGSWSSRRPRSQSSRSTFAKSSQPQ